MHHSVLKRYPSATVPGNFKLTCCNTLGSNVLHWLIRRPWIVRWVVYCVREKQSRFVLTAHVIRTFYAVGFAAVSVLASLFPSSVPLRYLRSLGLAVAGKYREACDDLHYILRVGAARPALYFYLGMLEMSIGQHANSEVMLENAVKLCPEWGGQS